MHVTRAEGVVEIDNGLVKARFSTSEDGVKQEYLAARGAEWVLLAEGFRPRGSEKAKVEVFADFEGTTYGDWQAVGDAFGAGPSPGATAPEQLLQGFRGKRLANSYAKSDVPVGKLVSPEFTIRQPYIGFLIGGGHHPGGTCINLVVDGKTLATQTGENSDTMSRAEWCVTDSIGKKARIEIVDNVSGGWGHIEIDQIEFVDQPRGSVASLYDTSIDPAHRFLASEALQSIGQVEEKADSAQVILRGKSGETVIEQMVELQRGHQLVHIEVKAALAGNPPKLEYLLAPLVAAINGKLDATHAPTYKPTADSVIGDRVFFAPVVCVQQGGLFVGLAPDLDVINRHVVYAKGARQHPDSNSFPISVDPAKVSMPTALDLELPSGTTSRPVLSYGMMDYIVHQHVWFQHSSAPGAMVRELSSNEARIGMDLLLSADAPKCRGYQMAAQHLWRRFGGEYFRRPRPQAMPNAEYAKVCYPANFQYQGYDVAGERLNHRQFPDRPDMRAWQQWEVDGRPVGGLRLYAPQWYNLITNLAWWNNACDATGFYYWGKQLDNQDLLDKARRMVNLALSAPQNQGLFPAIYDFGGKRWLRSLWGPPLEGYNPGTVNAYWDWNHGGAYQTAAASVTAGYLLQYRRTCEDDQRILPYVRRYGDFLLANMPPNGCVPGWFTADLKPLPSLKWNADGGAHAWVLSELYLVTKEQKYLDAARQSAKFLLDEVMPQQRWADFEAFYSCATKPETYFDARTGQWPCNTMSVSWALQGFLALHEATQDKQYLDAAAAAADFAALFQAAWAPNYVITAYPFGGMSSQLGDSEWLDQRAHRFADPFVRIGLLTGRQDLIERGIAAARSSLTLANHPRHLANGIYTHTDFPVGLGPENIDHEGFPQRPLSSGPSWNSIGGLAGVAHVMQRLGGAYVDFERNLAAGVDGLKIVSFQRQGDTIRLKLESQLAALPTPYDQPYVVEVRMVGLPAGEYNLVVNDQAPLRVDAAQLAHYSMKIEPGAGQIDPDQHTIGKEVQAGFYTPGRTGGIWDNWACYHEGTFYLFYVAGPPGKNDPRIPFGYLKSWNSFELATSEDGVHWKQYGTVARCRKNTQMGSGHIWKSPDFAKDRTWIMNYSEFFGEAEDYWSHVPNFCGQNIIFLTSTDLLHWTKVDESLRFGVDGRWYKEKGRWDSMDVLPRPDGSLYAYFTAEPVPEKIDYKACYAVGFAESKDGLRWHSLPPLPGDTAGEVGGIEKIGGKYYMTIGAGEIFCADRPEGPFLRQKKNPNMLDKDSHAYYSRFFHTAPGGPLVNNFYMHGIAYAAPFKAIDIDADGILRLKWWKGNEKLKEREVHSALAANSAESRFVRFLEPTFNLDAVWVIEASLMLPENDTPTGFYLDSGDGKGQVVLFTRQGAKFGTANVDGSGVSTGPTPTRDIDFAGEVNVRLVMKKDMIETYMNDYLMNTKRMKCKGRIGVIGQMAPKNMNSIKVWTENK